MAKIVLGVPTRKERRNREHEVSLFISGRYKVTGAVKIAELLAEADTVEVREYSPLFEFFLVQAYSVNRGANFRFKSEKLALEYAERLSMYTAVKQGEIQSKPTQFRADGKSCFVSEPPKPPKPLYFEDKPWSK